MNEAKNVLAPFVLAFAGLKEGIHNFSIDITSKFFDAFDYTEFNDVSLCANIELNKKATLLELQFAISGTLNLSCDVSNEPFDLPLDTAHDLVVKFGEAYNDENEDLLVLPHGSHEIDVSQTLYETIVLAVPQKRVHPGIANGSLQSDLLDRLEALRPKESTKAPETTD
ncbi:MAG: YceD family protein, partial [Flavobacteriaceae bacterium]